MHGGQLLHQVDAVAVVAVEVRRGKQRHKIEPQRPCVLHREYQVVGRRWLDGSGLQRKMILLPGSCQPGNGGGCEGLAIRVS